jgi:hypothetical protein
MAASCSNWDADMTPATRIACLAFALALAGCGGDKPAASAQAPTESLPGPDAGQGAVTGMPDTPGPGAIGAPEGPAPATTTDAVANADATDASSPPDAQGVAVGEQNPSAPAGPAVEPGADDPAQVLRDYYAAIDARDYGRAWRLWSEGGAASHQSLQQFAGGFADTRDVSVELGAPGDEDAGAGQRYIEIPATVTAIHADGSRHRYTGSYVLHRTVVDGASAEQRAWRIYRANLRETGP